MGGINDQCVTGIHLLGSCGFLNGDEILMKMICPHTHKHTHTVIHIYVHFSGQRKFRFCEQEREGAGTRECHPVCFLGPPIDFAVFNMFTYSARRQVRITNAATRNWFALPVHHPF